MKDGWQIRTLGEILQKTETFNPFQSPDAEFDYIDVSSVSNTTFQIENTQHIKAKNAPSRARRLVKTNDVLFATVRPTLRRIAVVPESLNNQVCSTGYFILRPKVGIDHRFVFYTLFTEDFINQMEILQKGASYPAVTEGEVKAQTIPIPPFSEQQRIVRVLDEVYAGIAKAKANTEKNKVLAHEILESVVNRCFSQINDYEEKRLAEVTDLVTDYVANGSFASLKKNVIYRKEKDFAILLRLIDYSRDFEGDFVYVDKHAYDFLHKSKLYPGDIIISNVGARLGTLFKVPNLGFPMTLGPNSILLRSQKLGAYIYEWLKSSFGQKTIQQIVSGAGQPKFNKTDFRNLLIPIPKSDRARNEIIETICNLNEKIQRLESLYNQKLISLDDLKNSLLHQAFNGDL